MRDTCATRNLTKLESPRTDFAKDRDGGGEQSLSQIRVTVRRGGGHKYILDRSC